MSDPDSRSRFTRRAFLTGATAGLAVLTLPRVGRAALQRRLAFENLHTGENISMLYRTERGYEQQALTEASQILRDHRSGLSHPIDPRVFDLLYDVQHALGAHGKFRIVSGYRSPATNRALRREGHNVAVQSLHMVGKAVDVRLDGVSSRTLRDGALRLARGGVGYYPSSDFIHLDVGPVRSW